MLDPTATMTEAQDKATEFDEPSEQENVESPHDAETVSYFGTDFDVHGLVRRLKKGDIQIPSFDPAVQKDGHLAGFQRKFVWRSPQMHKFVESILLGFPVPDIFLVQQKNKTLLVLDGQQRLRTLQKFYDDEFALENTVKRFQGLRYSELDDEQRRALDNFFIHATVIKYSDSPEGAESVYMVFERLNAGGTNLHPHEIRVALYNGGMVSLIRELNSTESWRSLYGPVADRLKDQELILRFIALYLDSDNYERPLKSFLNSFLRSHRGLEGIDSEQVTDVFKKTCAVIDAGIGRAAFRLTNSINSALVDAVMIGVARRLEKGPINVVSRLSDALEGLKALSAFRDAIGRATADEERVKSRLDLATEAFAKVE